MKLIKVGIIGTGYGATVHLPAFMRVPGARVVALADAGSGRAQNMCLPGIQAFSDWRELLKTSELDAVIIATPPDTHLPITLAAFANGVSVLCEKPMGTNAGQATTMLEAARKHNRRGWIGCQFRFEPGIAQMAQMIKAGEIGELLTITIRWLTAGRADPARPWSWQNDRMQGGGVINSFLPHVIDLIHFISNQSIVRTSSTARVMIPERMDAHGITHAVTAEDWVDAHFSFASGLSAHATVSNCDPRGTGFEIDVTGASGRLVYHHRPPFTPSDMSLALIKDDMPSTQIPLSYPEVVSHDSRFVAAHGLAQAVVDDMMGQDQRTPNFTDGLKTRCILDTLHSSFA